MSVDNFDGLDSPNESVRRAEFVRLCEARAQWLLAHPHTLDMFSRAQNTIRLLREAFRSPNPQLEAIPFDDPSSPVGVSMLLTVNIEKENYIGCISVGVIQCEQMDRDCMQRVMPGAACYSPESEKQHLFSNILSEVRDAAALARDAAASRSSSN